MSLLNANDLAAMRAVQKGALPDSCVLYSVTETVSETGAVTRNVIAKATAACRLAPQTAPERQTAEQIAQPDTYLLTLAYDEELIAGDRVYYGGTWYEVLSVDPGSAWKTATRAIIRNMVT